MAAPKQQLSLFDAVCIILGVIIGAGIFRAPHDVANFVPNSAVLIGIWVAGGVLSLLGALCYAELTSSMPSEGGDYVYLTKAYGRAMGFLFAWSEFWIIRPGSIGAMAYVFATYAADLLPAERQAGVQPWLAAAAVVVLTLTNLFGVRSGKWTQNVLTVAKVAGLLAVIIAGFLLVPFGRESPPLPAAGSPSGGNFSLALIFVLFAYGGWNDISFVAAEVKHPQRNMFRALALGVTCVAAIYVLINVALLLGLGFDGLAAAHNAPAKLVEQLVGPGGSRFISVLICLATLGAINAMIFTGSRIYYALGKDHRLFAFLAHWNGGFDAPLRSIVLQSLVAIALVLSFGGDEGQFERMVIFTTPLFWLFIMLVGISSILLRLRLPDLERPYRMPLYPLPAIVLGLVSLFMVYSSLRYSLTQGHAEGYWTLGLLLVGAVLSMWNRPRQATS